MVQLSALNIRARIGLLMALRGYFDSSGKHEDPSAKVVTLAGYAAVGDVWDDLEREWQKVLAARLNPPSPRSPNGTPYFHSKEAMHLTKGYSRNDGWDDGKV